LGRLAKNRIWPCDDDVTGKRRTDGSGDQKFGRSRQFFTSFFTLLPQRWRGRPNRHWRDDVGRNGLHIDRKLGRVDLRQAGDGRQLSGARQAAGRVVQFGRDRPNPFEAIVGFFGPSWGVRQIAPSGSYMAWRTRQPEVEQGGA
jgi:hypothetical protein